MHASAGESVEIDGQGGDEGFAFAGGHYRDASRMERVTANKLNIERDHFPLERMLADNDFCAPEPAAGILHHCKSFGEDFAQAFGELLIILNFREFFFPSGCFLPQSLVGKLL